MPTPVTRSVLSPEHEEYRKQHYEAYDTDEFIELVCNQSLVLPVHRLGNLDHLPCGWVGTAFSKASLPEERELQKSEARGWRPTRVMLILPSPNAKDVEEHTVLHPKTRVGRFLRDELKRAGLLLGECVATHVCRFTLPRTLNKYEQRHKKEGLPYLQADIEHCKPDVIIAFGADAVKALYGRKAKLDTYQGDVLDYEIGGHSTKVIPTYSPFAFLGGHAEISVFRKELVRAREVKDDLFHRRNSGMDYRICATAEEVEALCQEIRKENPPWVAFDTEFGNRYAREEHNETLSIQLSWGPRTSAFIQLTEQVEVVKPHPDVMSFEEWAEAKYKDPWKLFSEKDSSARRGEKRYAAYVAKEEKAVVWRQFHEYDFEYKGKFYKAGKVMHSPEDWHRIWYSVQQLLLDRNWRICAQHLRVDCEQFDRNGYPITERIEDGIDTMLIHHLLYGDESQGLDHLVRKYCPSYGAFWRELEEYLESTGKRNKHLQFGYRDIPYEILIPYAQIDADVTWQVALELLKELNQTETLKRLYFRHVAPTSWHLYQVERQGILIDEEQRSKLRDIYEPVYSDLLVRVREEANWPSLNPASDEQIKMLLYYGHKYKNAKTPPEGAHTLGLQPLFNTDKYPKDWKQILEEGEEEYHTPAVSAEALDLLHSDNSDIRILRLLKHLSVIGKFLSTYLAPQIANEFGVPEDGKGFHNNIWSDGRVRTRLSQLTTTGRYSSSKANLQTKPKKQEAAAFEALVEHTFECSIEDYEKRTYDGETDENGNWLPGKEPYQGPDRIEPEDRINVPKFASCFVSRPGYCLIEADFATAELCIWAYVSGDPALIEVVQKGRDLHSEVCATAFKLPELEDLPAAIAAIDSGDKATYDAWSSNIKKKYSALRIAAKSVNFGVMYGRGAAALAREINKVVSDPVSPEDTQAIINGLAKSFPEAWEWLVKNSDKAVKQEYIENAFNRRRYFQGANQMSEWDQAAVRREAKNSPIQGAVADLLAQAGVMLHRKLRDMRREGAAPGMEILLPVHDAFLFEIKYEDVPKALSLIYSCMGYENKLPGTEHYLGVDVEIFPHRWSDKGYDPEKEKDMEEYRSLYVTSAT